LIAAMIWLFYAQSLHFAAFAAIAASDTFYVFCCKTVTSASQQRHF
jgi:hypothetical protein